MELSCKQAAKLVLGYLKSEDCMKAHQEFLRSCRHLKDVSKSGKYVATRVQGMNLTDILSDYARVYTIVQERLEETDFYNDRHRPTFLAHQLLFLLDGNVPTRCSTPNIMSRCSTPFRYPHLDSPFLVQPSPDINATPLGSLPGNAETKQPSQKTKVPSPSSQSPSNSESDSDGLDKNESTQLAIQTFAESLLKQQDLQEKIADNINKVIGTNAKEKEKDGNACDDIDSAIKAVLDKTESDPAFDSLMGEIIGSVNTAQQFPDNNIFEPISTKNDQFGPSCFSAPPTSQPTHCPQPQPPQCPQPQPPQCSQPQSPQCPQPPPPQCPQPQPPQCPQSQPPNGQTMDVTTPNQQSQPVNGLTISSNTQNQQPHSNSIQHQQSTNDPATAHHQQQAQPAKINTINQPHPVNKVDAPKNIPGEIIVYEGSLESYMKSGAGGAPPPANIQTTELHPSDGQKNKQKGKQILFISNTPFNIVPQNPTQIKLTETDIISMPTVIVCDKDPKPTTKPVLKKLPPKPEKKVKTLPPRTPTLSEFITLYKCDDDDSNEIKVPEGKTLKTIPPRKKTVLKRIDPPKIEILSEHSKSIQNNPVGAVQPVNYAPIVSNFTPLVPNNQFTSTTYEPQTTSGHQPSNICNQVKILTQPQNNLLTTSYQTQDANITPNNQNQILIGATNNIFPSTNSTFSLVNTGDHNKFLTADKANRPVESGNDKKGQTLTIETTPNQFVENLPTPIEINQNKNLNKQMQAVQNQSNDNKGQNPLVIETDFIENLSNSIENNQNTLTSSNKNLNNRMQAVQNQSNLLKLIQNQNDLILSAQNGNTDETNNELTESAKTTNATKTNRKVTITNVIDVGKLTEGKKVETETKITPGDKIEKKKSASTPRSGSKSHVRALDFKFKTPVKDVIDVKSVSASPSKKKSPTKAKTAKSLFTNLPGSNPIIKKKELIKPKSAGSWDIDLRALTASDPAVTNAPPKPKPKTRKKPPAKPKAEPKSRKKADAKKNNSKSEDSTDKDDADRPSKRTRSKSVKSPQKVITVTTDPHNKECVSIIESEGKVEDLLKSNEAKAAINSESQTHSQINLIKCNSKPRYNKKCNIDNPTRKDPVEEINENTASNSKFLTPELTQSKSNEIPTVKKNIMPMLETPVKDVCPKTPRPQSPRTIEDTPFTKVFKESFNDIDLHNIQTPKFLDTPNFALTPLLETKSPTSHRGTDYSTSSSYYQPSDTEQNKFLESYIKEECKRAQKRITPIKVEEPMELETEQLHSKIHSNEKEQLELVCNKSTETTHKAIADKLKSLSNNVIARKNLSLVNRKIVSSEESSSEDTDSSDTTDSSDSSSTDEETTVIKNKSRDSSLTRYSLRTTKSNNSKELSEPPEEDIKSILTVAEYTPALVPINLENEETKRKRKLLAEMEEKRQRTIAIFKNGAPAGNAEKPPAKKRAPPKPKKSPAKKPATKTQPVKRNLRSNARKKPTVVTSPKDNLQRMGLAISSSDEDDLQPLQVVETEMLSSSKSNTPAPDSKPPDTKPLASSEKTLKDPQAPESKPPETRPLASFEKTLENLSKEEHKSKETEVFMKSTPNNDKEAQNLVEGLKERGIYLMHKKISNTEDTTKEIGGENDEKLNVDENLEEGEIVSEEEEIKKKSPVVNRKKKLNPAPKIPASRNKPNEKNKEKKNDSDNNKTCESSKDKKKDGNNKNRESSKDRKKERSSVEKKKEHSSIDNLSGEGSKEAKQNDNEDKRIIKSDTNLLKKVEDDIQKAIEKERNKPLPELVKKVEQTRRKSIHLEKKIEELKNKRGEQPCKILNNLKVAKEEEKTDCVAVKKSASQTKKITDIAKKAETKKPVKEQAKKPETKKPEEEYDQIDTSIGEHIELDFYFGTHVIEYTYNSDEEHNMVTWDKALLYKKRAVDIYVDALDKNITRPIALIGNDNIFTYRPPQNRRKSIHVIEDVKIQSKKPLKTLYNNLVMSEPVVNLSTKSPLDELYSSESKQYNQTKTSRQPSNDRTQANRVTKKADNAGKKAAGGKKTDKEIEKNVISDAAPGSSRNKDLKTSNYHEMMATPDRSEYDSLMDFSLVLSGSKRKLDSDDENQSKRKKLDCPTSLLNKVNIDEFLNMLHDKPKET